MQSGTNYTGAFVGEEEHFWLLISVPPVSWEIVHVESIGLPCEIPMLLQAG